LAERSFEDDRAILLKGLPAKDMRGSNGIASNAKSPFLFKRTAIVRAVRVRQKTVLFESAFLDGSFN